jgi:hypothetical protein
VLTIPAHTSGALVCADPIGLSVVRTATWVSAKGKTDVLDGRAKALCHRVGAEFFEDERAELVAGSSGPGFLACGGSDPVPQVGESVESRPE